MPVFLASHNYAPRTACGSGGLPSLLSLSGIGRRPFDRRYREERMTIARSISEWSIRQQKPPQANSDHSFGGCGKGWTVDLQLTAVSKKCVQNFILQVNWRQEREDVPSLALARRGANRP